jgi:hypothetical protein
VGGEAEDRDDDHDVAHHRHQDDQRQHQARAYRLPASRSTVSFNPILHTWIGDRNLTIHEFSFKWVKVMLPYKSGRGLLVVGGGSSVMTNAASSCISPPCTHHCMF